MQIEHRVFLVTGAGSWLGEAVTRHLTAEGAYGVVADVQAASGAKVVNEIASTHVSRRPTSWIR